MNVITVKHETAPICRTCGQPMKGWHMMQTDFEHSECSAKRIGASLADLAIQQITKGMDLPPISQEARDKMQIEQIRREVEGRYRRFIYRNDANNKPFFHHSINQPCQNH